VTVDFANHTADVQYDYVTISKGKKVRVFWSLPADTSNPAQNCYFYSHAADGVFFKQFTADNGQFKDQGPVDEPKMNPKPEPMQAKHYFWYSFKNDIRKEYEYKVVFHCGMDLSPYVIDPVIFNEGP